MKKQTKFLMLMLPLVILLTGCGTPEPITTDPSGIWGRAVYLLAQLIVQLGRLMGNNIGWGLVLATLIIRGAMIPLYRKQIKTTEAMNKIQPEMKKIQNKYKKFDKSDREAQMRQQQELSALYKRHGVNPFAGCLPLLIQMPILFAFYDAIRGLLINGTYTNEVANAGLLNLTNGINMSQTFLGFDLGARVILFAILAGLTTWLSTKLGMIGAPQTEGTAADVTKSMLVVMPVMIFVMGLTLPGALSIYWLVGNLVTIFQTLYFKRDQIFNARRDQLTK